MNVKATPVSENNRGSCLFQELILGIDSILKKFTEKKPIKTESVAKTTNEMLRIKLLSRETFFERLLPFSSFSNPKISNLKE
jgi:hypothetical protein